VLFYIERFVSVHIDFCQCTSFSFSLTHTRAHKSQTKRSFSMSIYLSLVTSSIYSFSHLISFTVKYPIYYLCTHSWSY